MISPSDELARIWFSELNRLIFDNKLGPVDIEITNLLETDQLLGECQLLQYQDSDDPDEYKIRLNNKFKSEQLFLSILGHEMVHMYQFSINDTGNHNKIFYSFREKFIDQDLLLSLRY